MEIKRVITEGCHVAVHVHHLDPGAARVGRSRDWLRLDANGRIVEHRDVMQRVPEDNEVKNKNIMFREKARKNREVRNEQRKDRRMLSAL